MKYLPNDKSVYIEWKDLTDCGISDNTLKSANQRKSIPFIDDPDKRSKQIVPFQSLPEKYQQKIEARFGNVYEYMGKKPIRDLIKWDDNAELFYLAYTYDQDKKLSIEHVQKYTAAASVLNMLKKVNEDKKQLKQLLKLTLEQFYIHVIEIIKNETVNNAPIDLPTSYRRLQQKQKEYNEKGFAALIDWRFGNKLAAKVKDELSESTLLEMLANGMQHDDVFITWQYNKWATGKGYKTIDKATVGYWRRKRESEIVMEREGNAELKNRFLRVAKGHRPTQPLYLVESDDNHLDFAFIDPDNSKGSPRYIAIVVTDSYNDYVLGYAYALAGTLSEGQSIALVKAAYVNAMYYVRSITGAWYLPHETKSDNWAIKSLQPFYENIAKYIKTPVGSKNRGYIENFFGSAHWKRCLKVGANNYLGNNMTAKFRGVNTDLVARNKKNWPMIGDEAYEQIETFFHNLRHLPQSNGESKHDQWLSAFNALPAEQKRFINDEQFLLKFGIEHNHHDEGLRITNRGVQPKIKLNGQSIQFNYDLENYRMEDINKRVTVIYDPYDMSRVLVTDFQNFRMMARDARLNSRALADSKTESRTYLNSILNEKKEEVQMVSDRSQRRKQVLKAAGIEAETLLQSGVMVKEIKQAAEQRMIAKTVSGDYASDDFYDQM